MGDGSTDWNHLAARLHGAGWLGADALPRVEQLVWFGRLIANSDMHTGNLSFRPVALAGGAALQLAPVYDMLPMRYAPLPGGEVPPRSFDPPAPLPAQRTAWLPACAARPSPSEPGRRRTRASAPGFGPCAGPMHRACKCWRRGSEHSGLRPRGAAATE